MLDYSRISQRDDLKTKLIIVVAHNNQLFYQLRQPKYAWQCKLAADQENSICITIK